MKYSGQPGREVLHGMLFLPVFVHDMHECGYF